MKKTQNQNKNSMKMSTVCIIYTSYMMLKVYNCKRRIKHKNSLQGVFLHFETVPFKVAIKYYHIQ